MNKIIIANMKMNLYDNDIHNYIKEINSITLDKNVIFCPTSIYIPYFLHHDFSLGIQNIYCEDSGAFTGEISPRQAASIGIKYAIIGHSERRSIFKENTKLINLKIKATLKNDMIPVVCLGETKIEKDCQLTKYVLKKYLQEVLKDISSDKIIFAYEPIWAIGTGVIPSNEEISSTISFIKQEVIKLINKKTKVLYGGSVNLENINTLKNIKSIDGFLVGGLSNNPEKFIKLVKEVRK